MRFNNDKIKRQFCLRCFKSLTFLAVVSGEVLRQKELKRLIFILQARVFVKAFLKVYERQNKVKVNVVTMKKGFFELKAEGKAPRQILF